MFFKRLHAALVVTVRASLRIVLKQPPLALMVVG
jgi:hypothetical protein